MKKSELIRIIIERMRGCRVDEPEKFINEVLDICLEQGMQPPEHPAYLTYLGHDGDHGFSFKNEIDGTTFTTLYLDIKIPKHFWEKE